MRCPYCSSNKTGVIDSRESQEQASVRRRRECKNCERRFTTYERIEMLPVFVVKRSGRKELFSAKKLLNGLILACEKRNIERKSLDSIVEDIELRLLSEGICEISSEALGRHVIDSLKSLDDIAYLRYASVYKSFSDLDEFQRELQQLSQKNDIANLSLF